MAKASRVAARTVNSLEELAAAIAALEPQLADLGKRLDRIERKVDALAKPDLKK